jgi:hypothetical protein
MLNTNVYQVAGHRFAVTAEDGLLQKMDQQYGPFLVKDDNTDGLVFWLEMVENEDFPSVEGVTKELMQDEDAGIKILTGSMGQQSYYEFWLRDRCEGRMLTDADRKKALLVDPNQTLFALNNAIMLMFAMATARLDTALFHSSVVEHQGRAYMFLGKSGTGKSTHSQLWIKYIPETQLVNDDNPVVRVNGDGTATVYGSPWSGKTPCYRNVSYPIGGIVKLRQAPENRIRRLRGVEAYVEMIPNISGERRDKTQADGIHATENALVMNVPIWFLDCLPDEEAARLCYETISKK